MAGPIQVGDIITFARLAWEVWEYGWGSENNAGEHYRAFGADVRSLHTSLHTLEHSVNEAQTSLRSHGARDEDLLGGNRGSLSEIIGDYEATLQECSQLLRTNQRYDQTTGPARNIDWNINIMPQVNHLRRRIQMHNSRIQHVLKPFEIDLINKFHGDLVRRMTSIQTEVLFIRRNLNTLIAEHFPEVARVIEQQAKEEFCAIGIPESIAGRLESMFNRYRNRGPTSSLTLQGMTDCFLAHYDKSTIQFVTPSNAQATTAPVLCYLELLKCQFLMDRVNQLNEVRRMRQANDSHNSSILSHWPGYIRSLEEKLSQQCSRFQNELVPPDISSCEDELLAFWPEDAAISRRPLPSTGPRYGEVIEVPLVPEQAVNSWRRIRVLRQFGSEISYRIIESWGYANRLPSEDPKVVNFDIRDTALIPLYADPEDKDDPRQLLEIVLESDDYSHHYSFLEMKDLLLFQQAITGFKVVNGYTEHRAWAAFIPSGQREEVIPEAVTVQLWEPCHIKEQPEGTGAANLRRPSTTSQHSTSSGTSHSSHRNSIFTNQTGPSMANTAVTSMTSTSTITVRLDKRAASTGYGVMRVRPTKPLLVLFTRSEDTSKRSIVAITIDDGMTVDPELCSCLRDPTCPITAIERRLGESTMLQVKQLRNCKPWDLMPFASSPLTKPAESWDGLIRVSVCFRTVEARKMFGGVPCDCQIVTEGDVDACLARNHQGLLGPVKHGYRRQMILWREHEDNRQEVRRDQFG